ncbi:MAG: guanylate kinase [Microbacteriaceae bacterium]|nr:guanylate kinase [Microbacteriaceae bacterium]
MPRLAPPEVDRVAAAHAAVAARRARAAVKLAVHDRTRSAVDVLETAWADPPAAAEASLRVRELLTSIPSLGPTRVAKAMRELGIADSKRVGGLGVRQRRKLLEWLDNRENRGGSRDLARLVVLAGPTAVGKGTVSTYIRENYPDVHLSVSATTRAPRPGEVDGVNYFFVSDEEFDRLETSGQMLETATVHNAFRYGTPRAPIDEALAAGKSVLLEIDLQGARSVRRVMPEAVLVFLLPPTWEELVRRLIGRGTEDSAEQQRRLETAKAELAAQDEFDFRVVNSEVSTAAREVVDLMVIPKNYRSSTHG